jgi:hypothetical protein
MSDNNENKVSEEGQDSGLPSPTFSDKPVSPTSALGPDAIAEISKALLPAIEEQIDRKFKSTTDKRFSKLEKGDKALGEILASLEKQGVQIPAEVKREYDIKDYINQRIEEAREVSQPVDNGMSATGTKSDGRFDALKTIKSLNLDVADPDTVALMKGTYHDAYHFEAEAAKLALRKATKPTAQGSGQPPLGGGNSSAPDMAALTSELQKLQKMPMQNAVRIKEIEKQLGW